MKSFARYRLQSWLPICIAVITALFSLGCTSSRSNSGATTNPLAAYDTLTSTSTSTSTVIGDGSTITPGSLVTPVISVPEDGSTSINGHDNAPLLDNSHPGWQQSSCLSCHNETSNNPDHNYSDDSLCYLCHGTNGLPGLSDSTPPVLSSVVVSPTENSVTISWKSDKDCVSRLIIKTTAGDRMEFPASTDYTTSHKRTVTGLLSSTTYYYELTCTDKSGNKTSTSSFSSNLMFQTTDKIKVVESSGEEETTEEENLDETNGYFEVFKVDSTGMNIADIHIETKPTPRAKTFWVGIYKTKVEARKKAAGSVIWEETYITSGTNHTWYTDRIQSAEKNKSYFCRIGVTFADTNTVKWSDIRSFRFQN